MISVRVTSVVPVLLRHPDPDEERVDLSGSSPGITKKSF